MGAAYSICSAYSIYIHVECSSLVYASAYSVYIII